MPDESFLSWPFFEPRHREHARQLDRWAADALAGVDHHAPDAACRTLVAVLGREGWLEPTAPPPEQPDAPFDVRTLALSRETLARHDGLADFAFAMQGLGAGPISLFGSIDQRLAWVSRTRAGTAIAAFALTESGSGSDVAALTTMARRDGDGWVLDGEKTWISNGGIADVYVVFARTGEAPGAKGLSAFIVPATTPGLTVAERLHAMAPHPLARIRFEGCRLPASALIGAAGDGFRIAMATLDVFRATVGAAALGFARRALDEAVAVCRDRQRFGAPLAAAPDGAGPPRGHGRRHRRLGAAGLPRCLGQGHRRRAITREAAMAKLHATECAQRVIDTSVQLHGGDGVRAGQVVERLYREIRALRIYEGASDVQRVVIARAVLAGDGTA